MSEPSGSVTRNKSGRYVATRRTSSGAGVRVFGADQEQAALEWAGAERVDDESNEGE